MKHSTNLRIESREPTPNGSVFWDALAFAAILGFFLLSGACGLLYQVVWTRKLVLLFGTTAYAVSTVLSIFFLGLGVGSLWGGRLADRVRNPLRLYGVFEILVGIWAVLFVLLVGYGESVVVGLLRTFAFSRGTGIALRAVLAGGLLIVPVTLMGATLPLLAKFVTTEHRVRGLRIGALYSVNTFGAVAGCALAGFWLLATFGYTTTTLIGAAANCTIGLLALALSFRRGGFLASPGTAGIEPGADDATTPRVVWLVILAFGLSGFCALALEVLWTRLLAMVFIGTTYAFTTMLSTLLCGIAVGSAVASVFVDRRRHPVFRLGLIEILFGLSCIYALYRFADLPAQFKALQVDVGFDWGRLVKVKVLLSFGVLFLPTFLSGMTFPVVVRAVAAGRPSLGRDIGHLYSANTFGGVLGALAGGYVLIPMLGTHAGILVLALVLCGVGAVLVLACPTGRAPAKVAALVLSGALLAGLLHYAPDDVGRLMSQAYVPEGDKVIHYREGVEGTVAVSEPAGGASGEAPGETSLGSGSNRVLWINGVQATASIEKGIRMNRLQGVMPLLFDREPRRALFMCFGSGITAGMLSLGDFDRIDAVEISNDVLGAAHLFKTDNLDVINNPRVAFIVDDGRNFLLTTPNRYDVITFEPMPLALAGVSAFYTREYYQLCLDHLTPGGVVSQWVPLHSLNPSVVRSLAYTFTTVFPEYCAWFINADLFLVGSNQPLGINYARAMSRIQPAAIQEALRKVGLADPAELLCCFFMGKRNLDAYAQGGEIMGDDRPWAEFVAPKLMYERTVADSLDELAPLYESPVWFMQFAAEGDAEARQAIERRWQAHVEDLEGVTQVYGGMIGGGQEEAFKRALTIDPQDYTARYYLVQVASQRAPLLIRWEEADKGVDYLNDLLRYAPDLPDLHLLLGDCYLALKQPDNALTAYRRYRSLGGRNPDVEEQIIALERRTS